VNTEGETQILSRFRAGLREDLRIELLAREVIKLEKAYMLVQDLDTFRPTIPLGVVNQSKSSVYRPSSSSQSHKSSTHFFT